MYSHIAGGWKKKYITEIHLNPPPGTKKKKYTKNLFDIGDKIGLTLILIYGNKNIFCS